jgi:hypothetical protein
MQTKSSPEFFHVSMGRICKVSKTGLCFVVIGDAVRLRNFGNLPDADFSVLQRRLHSDILASALDTYEFSKVMLFPNLIN